MEGATPVSPDDLGAQQARFLEDPTCRLATNVTTQFQHLEVARDLSARVAGELAPQIFSHKIPLEGKATSQNSTGRCWMFAALNLARLTYMEKFDLDKGFELSQSFLFFYDKLERANYTLNQIVDTAGEPVDSRVVQHLLTAPLMDGGQWDMMVPLIKKYGLLPKGVFPEPKICCKGAPGSRKMNRHLTGKLRQWSKELRDMVNEGKADKAALEGRIQEMMAAFHRALLPFFGAPPAKFDWRFMNKKDEVVEHLDLTPQAFRDLILPEFSFDGRISLVNDPRNEYGRTYTVQRLGNVVEAPPVKYLNLPVDELRRYTRREIKSGRPVWFGCEVSAEFDRNIGVMDTEIFDLGLVLGEPSASAEMGKADRLRYGESLMTHAMVFTGFDVRGGAAAGKKINAKKKKQDGDKDKDKGGEEGKASAAADSGGDAGVSAGGTGGGNDDDDDGDDGPVSKWRVENSWSDSGANKGYLVMTDDWFGRHLYQIVLPIDQLSEEHQRGLDAEPIVLPPWDPMGALAQ